MSVARLRRTAERPARMPLGAMCSRFLIPIARTNRITNPSFEAGTTNWAAVGGSIARTTSWRASGAAGCKSR